MDSLFCAVDINFSVFIPHWLKWNLKGYLKVFFNNHHVLCSAGTFTSSLFFTLRSSFFPLPFDHNWCLSKTWTVMVVHLEDPFCTRVTSWLAFLDIESISNIMFFHHEAIYLMKYTSPSCSKTAPQCHPQTSRLGWCSKAYRHLNFFSKPNNGHHGIAVPLWIPQTTKTKVFVCVHFKLIWSCNVTNGVMASFTGWSFSVHV